MKNPKIKPREYQQECLAAIDNVIANGEKRALVVMASGLGKTYTSAFAVERYLADKRFVRVLVLCHSEKILRQTKEKFQEYFGEEFSYGMYVKYNKTTRPRNFLFATFQTMKENREIFPKDEFAYIIVDEAHHSHARTYFPTIRYFQPEFLLGLTATPDRLDGQKIEEIYGEPVYELGFVEATKRGLIAECDYRLVLDDLSQERLDEYLANDEKLSINQLNRTLFIKKRDEEIVRLISEYSAGVENPKTMVFCRTVEHARKIAKLIGDKAALVYKKNGDSANDSALKSFKEGEINTIISVDMLNEGIDVPDANVIVFLRNTVSPAVFYQQLGRGTRLSEGKDKVLVLDFVDNCERIKTILELKQEIDDFKVRPPHGDEGAHGDGDANSKEKFTLNIATPEFKSRMVDVMKLFERAVKWCEVSDQEYLDALVSYAKELGHTPSHYEVNSNPDIPSASAYKGRFKTYNNAVLLAGLKPNFLRVYMDNDTMLDCLKNFAEELGHTPNTKEVDANKKLPSAATYIARFGSFNRALVLAGLKARKTPKSVRAQKVLFKTKEDVIIALQKLHQKKGEMLYRADLDEDEKAPTYGTIRRFFPDFNSALIAAGIVGEVVPPTKQEVIQLMQLKYHECGDRTPTTLEIKYDKRFPCKPAIDRMFGSHNNLVRAAGLEVNKPASYPKGTIKLLLEEKAKELGHWPTMKEIDLDSSLPSTTTIRRLFGSVKESVIRLYVETTN